MPLTKKKYEPGTRLRVSQQMPLRDESWTTTVEGVVVRHEQVRTHSSYAHSRDFRHWLDRLELKKDDGELVLLNLDQFSKIEEI